MKNQMLMVVVSVLFGMTALPAAAQAGGVQAKVPFNFAVSGKTFPAGQYRMIPQSGQIKIQDANGKMIAMFLANDKSGHSAAANGQIIFHCYRERCFLAEVWSPLQENGRQLLVSRAEAALAKEESAKYFAILGEKPGK